MLDSAEAPRMPEGRAALGDPRGYFMRYSTDHHACVLFNKKAMTFRADALDPDAHGLQLYDYREQGGWDDKERPQGQPRAVQGDWPEAIEPLSDTYVDQVFQAPWE
jgi:hypothetical protein